SMTVTDTNSYTVSYIYDKNNRLISENNSQTGLTIYTYDNNGNQIAKGSDTFEYDGFNQMILSDVGGVESTYAYDGLGLRNSKIVDGSTTVHLWDGNQIVSEMDGLGNITDRYIRGINL